MTVPLTKKKRRWARNRSVTLRGNILNYNIAIQQKYRKQLQTLVDYMERYVSRETLKLFRSNTGKEYFKEQRQAEAMDSKNLGSQARILMNKLMRKFTQLFDDKSKDLAEGMISSTLQYSKSSLHSSLEQLSGGLSLKTGVMPEGMEDVTRALIAENVSLIKSIPEEYLKNVTGSVMRSITTGNGVPELTRALVYHAGVTDRRAKNIALDQTRKAYNSINKQRLQSLNVKQFEWIHSGGGQKPRQSHLKISGHIFNFETLEEEQEKLGVPYADRGIPGHPVNCFIGSTEVSLANGCINVWRYKHTGDVVTINVQGSSFTSTVNHPILTNRGWLSADEIQEGDYLASTVIDDCNIVKNKKTHNITTFDNLFDSVKGVRSREPFRKFNFHGDIPETDVDTISINDNLSRGVESFGNKDIENFVFALSNIVANDFRLGFDSKVFKSCFSGRLGKVCPFCFGKLTHPNLVCGACSSQNNAVFLKDSANNLTAAIPIFTQLQNTSTEVITIDDILRMGNDIISFSCRGNKIPHSRFQCGGKMGCTGFCGFAKLLKAHSPIKRFLRVNKKTVSKFNGHVYTMESKSGWYSISPTEIISKNCRCSMRPVINFEDE